jgi:hypothetical protein
LYTITTTTIANTNTNTNINTANEGGEELTSFTDFA